MLITKAPPAAPIVINSATIHLFMDKANPKAVCYLPLAGSSGLDLQLLNVTATGTVKPNQPGTIEIGLFAYVSVPHVDPPADTVGSWVMLGANPPEPIGSADDHDTTSWMVQGKDLMFNLTNGKMQGTFQSNVADNPVFPDNLNTNPNGIRDDVSPLMLFAVGAMFTPTADDGSTPVLTLAHFTLSGEV